MSVFIYILFSIAVGVMIVLAIVIVRLKNKVIRQKKEGIVNKHSMLANIEEVMSQIKMLEKEDKGFAGLEEYYLQEIDALSNHAMNYIDGQISDKNKIDDVIYEASFKSRVYSQLSVLLYKKQITWVDDQIIKGHIPFTITKEGFSIDETEVKVIQK